MVFYLTSCALLFNSFFVDFFVAVCSKSINFVSFIFVVFSYFLSSFFPVFHDFYFKHVEIETGKGSETEKLKEEGEGGDEGEHKQVKEGKKTRKKNTRMKTRAFGQTNSLILCLHFKVYRLTFLNFICFLNRFIQPFPVRLSLIPPSQHPFIRSFFHLHLTHPYIYSCFALLLSFFPSPFFFFLLSTHSSGHPCNLSLPPLLSHISSITLYLSSHSAVFTQSLVTFMQPTKSFF